MAWAALPEMERRESPAAREAAVIEMVLKEVIVDRDAWLGCRFPPMNTPSPESMAEVMTTIKRCCDLAHCAPKSLQRNVFCVKNQKFTKVQHCWKVSNQSTTVPMNAINNA